MGWLVELIKPVVGWLWQAFRGIGHTMDVHVCTSPHAFALWVGAGEPVPDIPQVAPHLDLKLRIWNKGGPDVTIIAWQIPELTETFTVTGYPTGHQVLEKSGKVLTIEMRLDPKRQPMSVKPGDSIHMTLHLSNGLKKHFKTTVTDAQGISR